MRKKSGKATRKVRTESYDSFVSRQLQDAGLAARYLSLAFEEGSSEEFLLALRNVAKARGGIATLSKTTNLNRQAVYRILSGNGNPTLGTLVSVLRALGINLRFEAASRKAA